MAIAGLAAALAAAWPAFAQQGQQGRPSSAQPAPPARPADPRNDAKEPRRATMSPDERRDLRRDIRDHGREVYGDPKAGPPKR